MNKVQKDKQRSATHRHKSKDRVTRTPLKSGVNLCAPLGQAVTIPPDAPVVLHQLLTGIQYMLLSHGSDRKTSEDIISSQPMRTIGLVASLLEVRLCQ